MLGIPTPVPQPPQEANAKILVVGQDTYEEYLRDDAWSFEATNRLLEVVRSLGAAWGSVSKALNRDAEDCSKRYNQVSTILSIKIKRAKPSCDAGQSDPGTPSKKRRRRTAIEIDRAYKCEVPNCSKAYGSEGALKMHIKLKHPGVVLQAYAIRHDSSVPKLLPNDSVDVPAHQAPAQHSTLKIALPVTSPELLTVVPPVAPVSARYSDIPLLLMSVGTWEKRSLFCGDTMARFSYEERKFVWEIYNFNSLFARMEVPFDNVVSFEHETHDNTAKLTIELSTPPSLFEGVIQAHKPTTWKPTGDFTGGQAFSASKHTLHLLKASLAQPLEHLLSVEPHFKRILCSVGHTAPPRLHNKNHSLISNVPCYPIQNPSSTTPILVPAPTTATLHNLPTLRAVHGQIAFPIPAPTTTPSTPTLTPNIVPPLVPDTEDYGATDFALCSEDEHETDGARPYQECTQLLESVKRCSCIGLAGCNSPSCLCFKSLEACGDNCDCSDCTNLLNEEGALDLSASTPSSPPPYVFFSGFPPFPTAVASEEMFPTAHDLSL
jgi:hypothetical protein